MGTVLADDAGAGAAAEEDRLFDDASTIEGYRHVARPAPHDEGRVARRRPPEGRAGAWWRVAVITLTGPAEVATRQAEALGDALTVAGRRVLVRPRQLDGSGMLIVRVVSRRGRRFLRFDAGRSPDELAAAVGEAVWFFLP